MKAGHLRVAGHLLVKACQRGSVPASLISADHACVFKNAVAPPPEPPEHRQRCILANDMSSGMLLPGLAIQSGRP